MSFAKRRLFRLGLNVLINQLAILAHHPGTTGPIQNWLSQKCRIIKQ